MNSLATDLYDEIVHAIDFNKITDFPYKCDHFIYDKRFTPDFIVDDIFRYRSVFTSDTSGRYADGCFYNVFEELQRLVQNNDERLTYICDSKDLLDHTKYGDYCYYRGEIDRYTPFIFMDSSHLYSYPCRLYIFGEYTVEINEDNAFPIVSERNNKIRSLIGNGFNCYFIGKIIQDIDLPEIIKCDKK
jgi:hypothetical protein